MKKSIQTSIHIQASTTQVWQVLTDFENYPTWNPLLLSLNGNVAVGNTIAVDVQGMLFRPTVLTYIANENLTWLGKLWFRGLFDGEHQLRLVAQEDGSTILHHTEQFSGLLVRLFSRQLDTKTKAGFEAMNLVVKNRAEGKTSK